MALGEQRSSAAKGCAEAALQKGKARASFCQEIPVRVRPASAAWKWLERARFGASLLFLRLYGELVSEPGAGREKGPAGTHRDPLGPTGTHRDLLGLAPGLPSGE